MVLANTTFLWEYKMGEKHNLGNKCIFLNRVTEREHILLPVGGRTLAVLRGGPTPWMSKPSAHFTQVEVEDPDVAR